MANALNNIAKKFDKAIIAPLQHRLIGRKLVPVNKDLSGVGMGMQSVDYWTYANMSAAEINYDVMENNEDTVDTTEGTIRVPVIQKPYKIPYRAYQSYLMQGIPVDSDLAIQAAYLVAYEEDKLILDGWAPDGTNYVVNGLYQSANNTEASALDFGVYGNAIEKTGKAITELEADSVYGPYNMVLNPAQKNELVASESTTGRAEWERVINMLNEQGEGLGTVYSSPIMTAGTGMLLPVSDPVYYDLIVAKEPFNVLGMDSKQGSVSPIYGGVLDAITIRAKHTNAICTLTNI
jgi:uncharacterized linocin/CFP29 family protein